ncbi:uncharacterized protein [Anabrus simplex]|uniref:uncharacterized protein n=1 Tax=Anabrus simplex TaxID=316456 RepID=UPI0035A37DC1
MSVGSVLRRILYTSSIMSLVIWELSLGHNGVYELKFQKIVNYMKGEKAEKSPAKVLQARAERYNRTTIIANLSVVLTEDLCADAVCSVRGFEKMGIEYGRSTMEIPPTKCCDLMEQGAEVYSTMVAASNLPPTCPIKKGRYDMLNFYLDSAVLPRAVPGHTDWRFDVRVTCSNEDVFFIGAWVKFDWQAVPQIWDFRDYSDDLFLEDLYRDD